MEIKLKDLANLPVISVNDGAKIGEVGGGIIDPASGRLVALFLKKRFLGKELFIAASDLREISPKAVLVDSDQALVEDQEVLRVAEIRKLGTKIAGNKVKTESGQYLGRVKDAYIDLVSRSLARIELKGGLIAVEMIVKIEKAAIIVKDGSVKVKEGKRVPAAIAAP